MFGTIRKHQTWLWVVIIAVMILSLVVFFNPASDRSGRGGQGDLGAVEGVPVSKNDYFAAQKEAILGYFVMSGGAWPDNSSRWNAEQETYIRLFLNKKIKDHNIYVADEAVARAANNLLRRLGGGRPLTLEALVQHIQQRGLTEQDLARYLRNDVALQQLTAVVGLPGDLISPAELRDMYTRRHQEIVAHAVFFSGTNYQTSVQAPTPEILQEFYTNRMGLYELPERVQVHYVAFPISNFLAQAEKEVAGVTNLTARIEQEYQQRGTNAFPDAKTPDEARAKIREEFVKSEAFRLAHTRAGEFMDPLLTMQTVTVNDFLTAAQTNNLKVQTTAPFDEAKGPSEIEVAPNFASMAFRLTPEEPVPDRPLFGENAVYAVALAKQLPSEVQPYEAVKDRVAADYKHTRALQNAQNAGRAFADRLTTGLKSGKTFAEITTEAGQRTIALPPFSMSTTNLPAVEGHTSLEQFAQAAFFTEPGTASEFVPTDDGGFIVFVDKRLPIDEEKMKSDDEFLEAFRRSRRSEVINNWLNIEGSRALQDTPWMRRMQMERQQQSQPRS